MAGRPELHPELLQHALTALHERAMQDHRLAAEVQRARRVFFGDGGAPPSPVAHVRFLEWFLLERESEALGAVPIETFDDEDDEVALDESTVSVFAVVTVANDTAELRDLQDDEGFDVVAPAGSLQAGDLVVGRLYPASRGFWQLSPAMALYRPGGPLATAFRRDLARLDLERRLSQAELEHLLLRRSPPASAHAAPSPLEHLEAQLDKLLRSAGVETAATDISEALAESVRPGPVIGPLLDELAFDTDVDLESARRLLLQIWNAHREAAGPVPPAPAPAAEPPVGRGDGGGGGPPGESLGERLVRTLDEGLAGHEDVEQLFQRLEAMAGITPEEADDNPFDAAEEVVEEGLDAGGDFGDLGPLVQEFLWETGRDEDDVVAETLFQWVQLQQNAAVPRTDLEQITGQDLMRLLLHVYLGAPATARAQAVREALSVLQEFYAWAEREQELPVAAVLANCRGMLLDQLDRLQAAGEALSGEQAPGSRRPALLRVVDIDDRGIGVQIDDGGDLWIRTENARLLREGDLLLAATRGKGTDAELSGLVVVLPEDAESLMG